MNKRTILLRRQHAPKNFHNFHQEFIILETFAGAQKFMLPMFLLLIATEMTVAKWRNKAVIKSMDTVSSLSSGITNMLKQILGLTIDIVTVTFSYGTLRFF